MTQKHLYIEASWFEEIHLDKILAKKLQGECYMTRQVFVALELGRFFLEILHSNQSQRNIRMSNFLNLQKILELEQKNCYRTIE
jgi:hypothetical protein